MCICKYVRRSTGALKAQRLLIALEVQLQEVVSLWVWVLQTEFWSSRILSCTVYLTKWTRVDGIVLLGEKYKKNVLYGLIMESQGTGKNLQENNWTQPKVRKGLWMQPQNLKTKQKPFPEKDSFLFSSIIKSKKVDLIPSLSKFDLYLPFIKALVFLIICKEFYTNSG